MVSVYVDIDPSEVLDEISTKDLAEELAGRKDRGAVAASAPELGVILGNLTSWDLEGLAAAVCADDGRRVLDILRPVFRPLHHVATRAAFEALPRDPQTGRPVH